MTGILQSGAVTPGHLGTWTTDGVLQDGGPILASQKVLGSIRSANFNSIGDQPILIPVSVVAFQLTGIIVTNASVSLSVAAGGFYTAVSKGGSQIVANTQVYSALTGPDLLLLATRTAFAQAARFSSDNLPFVLGPLNQYVLAIYFSLTTPQGIAATADVYVTGIDLS